MGGSCSLEMKPTTPNGPDSWITGGFHKLHLFQVSNIFDLAYAKYSALIHSDIQIFILKLARLLRG